MRVAPLLTQSHPVAAGQPDQEIYATDQNWVYLTLMNETMNQVKFASNGDAANGPELPSNQPISFVCGPQSKIFAYAPLGATVSVIAQSLPVNEVIGMFQGLLDALNMVIGGLGSMKEKAAYGSGIGNVMNTARKGVK